MLSTEEVKALVLSLGKKIGLEDNSNLYPFFNSKGFLFSEGGTVFSDDRGYHYVVEDHGKVVEQHDSTVIEDILYPVFRLITFTLASKYEVKHRKEDEDSRRELWKEQLRLLKIINPQFVQICLGEINTILKDYPFKDGKGKDLL